MKPFILIMHFFISGQVLAENPIFVKVYTGASVLGNQDLSQSGLFSGQVKGESEASLGYRAGFSLGYQWNEKFSSEITWDYLTNKIETGFSDGTTFSEGDYSSRLHFINFYYHFDLDENWQSYIGVGLGLIEEIDIDIQTSEGEKSFSDSGGFGYQLIVGAEYELNAHWGLCFELTNIGFSGSVFNQEGGSSQIRDDEGYSPWNLNIGLKYSF